MDLNEAKALGREIAEIVSAGGDVKQSLKALFEKYKVLDLNDNLRKKAEACEAETLLVLDLASQPKFSTEEIAGVTVARFGNSWETLECCGELNVFIRKFVSWSSGNSRWRITEQSSARFELLTHENAIALIERSHIQADQ